MGTSSVFRKLLGHQVTFFLSPFFSICLSFSPSFSICLSLCSCYTTLKGLVDSDELQCPTWSILLRLSLCLGGAWCLVCVQLINFLFILWYVYLYAIVCVYASVCAKHRPHACHSYQGIPFGLWQGRNVTTDQHLRTQTSITNQKFAIGAVTTLALLCYFDIMRIWSRWKNVSSVGLGSIKFPQNKWKRQVS